MFGITDILMIHILLERMKKRQYEGLTLLVGVQYLRENKIELIGEPDYIEPMDAYVSW